MVKRYWPIIKLSLIKIDFSIMAKQLDENTNRIQKIVKETTHIENDSLQIDVIMADNIPNADNFKIEINSYSARWYK